MIKETSLIRDWGRVEKRAIRRDEVVVRRHPTPVDKELLADVVMNQLVDVLYHDPQGFLHGHMYYDVEVSIKVSPHKNGLDGVQQYNPIWYEFDDGVN